MLEKIKESWQKIKDFVKEDCDITRISFDTWISPLEVYDMKDENTVRIIYPNSKDDFAVGYISKKYSGHLKVAIVEVAGCVCDVEIISQPEENTSIFSKQEKNEDISSLIISANLNPRYTFDTFVVGNNNKFAHAVSLSVAESPAEEYNPLFIYGGPGLGKTHLMHSIANFILKNDPSKRILYVTSEVFTNELIDALRNKNGANDFKKKYRNVDILLIDDIQFIIGKESTQEEFFNTFNYLYENRKQIVISSDQPPKSFVTLEERLRSRFEWGLTVDITSPDYETRMAILRKKEDMEGYTIDNEILQYIASNIKTNIRELEGALTKMYAFSKLHPSTPLTLDLAKENLKDMIGHDDEKKLTPDHIINVVAEHFGVRAEDIKSPKRSKEIVLPRQITMYLIRYMTDNSLEEVGNFLGKRDHSTISYGFDKITSELNTNKNLIDTIEILKKKLSQ